MKALQARDFKEKSQENYIHACVFFKYHVILTVNLDLRRYEAS